MFFLDIAGDFGNTFKQTIKLHLERSVGSTTSRWIVYFHGKSVLPEAKTGSVVIQTNTAKGCRLQGGVVFVQPGGGGLLGKFAGNGLICAGYADTFVTVARGNSEDTLWHLV